MTDDKNKRLKPGIENKISDSSKLRPSAPSARLRLLERGKPSKKDDEKGTKGTGGFGPGRK
jgi:hypothetical protein